MKDSGIPWVGQIPADWEVGKVKGCLRRHEVKGHGDAMVLALYRDHGVVPKDSRDDNHNRTGKDTNDYKYVREGDLVINKMKAWQGSLSVSGYEGIVSPAYFIYEFVGHNLDRGFADYLLRSTYKQEFERVSGGIREGQWDLPRYDFEHMQLPLPSIFEQRRIADYLDERCAAIDEVRHTIEDEVEALRRLRKATIHRAVTKGLDEGAPMRDSGVEWIGEIPNHWICCRVKDVASRITDGSHLSPETDEGEFDFLSTVNLQNGRLDFDNCLKTSWNNYRYCVSTGCQPHRNDIIISKDGSVGKTTVVDFEREFVVASSLVIITPKLDMIVPQYLNYVLQSQFVQARLERMLVGAALKRVSVWKNTNLPITLPPLHEQQLIAGYLDERCAAIDSVIDARTKQLERLEDYRKALIFAYVTGKKEVPTHA